MGLQKSLQMMLTSAPIGAKEALALGLVDAVVAPEDLLKTACRIGLDIAANRRARNVTIDRTDRLEPLGEAGPIFEFARAQARKKAGTQPARPPATLRCRSCCRSCCDGVLRVSL